VPLTLQQLVVHAAGWPAAPEAAHVPPPSMERASA
jgi:hypothetical protein